MTTDSVSAAPVSSLRQRLIEDMTMRRFSRETQRNYLRDIGRLSAFLGRSGDETKIQTETQIPFNDVVDGDTNLILYAKAEYGRTTLLKELRFRSLSEAKSVRFPRIPVLIDFCDVGSNADNMLRKAKGGCEATPDGNDLESLLKLGHACVMIDDVIFTDSRRMKIVRDFVERYPKARYVISSPQYSATKMGASVDPELPVRFEFVEVRELRRNEMRQLLKNDDRCTDVEGWLDRLQDEFREINLPFMAANGSILIEILAEKYNFTPINRSVLMEQFVDSTLRKAALEQSRRETFDYTNKTSLLSSIAAWMARNDNYVPSRETVRGEMRNFIDNIGLNVPVDDLLSEFLAAKIFIERSDARISLSVVRTFGAKLGFELRRDGLVWGLMFMRRSCGAASAAVGWSFA